MNEKQVIAQKIIADAHENAQKITLNAEKKAESVIAQAKAIAKEQIDGAVALAKEEGARHIERRATIARLDGKKHILSAKQTLIKRVFARAEKMLESLPGEKYLALVNSQLESFAENGDTVILSEKACITESDILSLQVCKQRNLAVKKCGKFGGGIIIEGSKKDVDLTFKALALQSEEKYAGEVARKLFGENE